MVDSKNALISVYNKTGIEDFAKGLAKLGWKIYASGGTAKKIQAAGIDVTDVADLVGGEAILGHRVVTLSRELHAGILADKNKSEDVAELKQLGIPVIDLVCVDMYPLEEAIAQPDATPQSVLEMTDVGGPTMLRAAAKGRRIVLSKAGQRPEVLKWLKDGRPDENGFLKQLAGTAELEVAKYVFTSARYLGAGNVAGFMGAKTATAKYGENPWQKDAGLYKNEQIDDPLSLDAFAVRAGTEPSFNNYADIDRLLQTITHVAAAWGRNSGTVPAIALGAKHGNMCGAGVSDKLEEAVVKMLDGDPRAIFGGLVMLNGKITKKAADLLITHGMKGGKRLLDAVVAADIDDNALAVLNRKGGKLRVVTNPALGKLTEKSLDQNNRFRYVRGGSLKQSNYTFVLDFKSEELEKNGSPLSKPVLEDMQLAWAVGSTSNSNTITLIKNGQLIGNGVGQQDRVSAAELAIKRAKDAGHSVRGAVAYSDSFFPFPDGPLILAKAGAAAIFASRGSVKDDEVAKALTDENVTFYTMPDASARGFYAH